MTRDDIANLAADLERANRMTQAELQDLLRAIERYARQDLYGAAQMCRDHLHKYADIRLPTAIMAAEGIGKRFEDAAAHPRKLLNMYGEQDRVVRQPDYGGQYSGPIVGTTPNLLIQHDRETGDLIVHARHHIYESVHMKGNEQSVFIGYPFDAIGGVGLMRADAPELEATSRLEHQRDAAPAPEVTRELDMDQTR